MKTALIVAEFNPYHNGHKYIAEKARELTGADYVIALMSGDYVQRGAPAMIGTHARVRMALSSGIDMVIAFPTRSSGILPKSPEAEHYRLPHFSVLYLLDNIAFRHGRYSFDFSVKQPADNGIR